MISTRTIARIISEELNRQHTRRRAGRIQRLSYMRVAQLVREAVKKSLKRQGLRLRRKEGGNVIPLRRTHG